MSVRIIPRLDIKGSNLVKGVQLEGVRVLGRPEAFARHYYENGADELLFMDVVATLYGRNSLHEIIERTSAAVFIPLTVGGGLRTLDDIQAVLRAGADKVAINTEAIHRPEFIREAAVRFGSSTLVLSIEAKRRPDGSYEAYTDNGRERTGIDVFDWASRGTELGAGEVLVTSIDREGTGEGYDLELVERIAACVSTPVIACGGAGCVDDVAGIVTPGPADAAAVAAMLHYDAARALGDSDACGRAGNRAGVRPVLSDASRIKPCSLAALKRGLAARGVDGRYEWQDEYDGDGTDAACGDPRLRRGQPA